MNGDQNPTTPNTGWKYKPADNPSSLTEPSRPTSSMSTDELRRQLAGQTAATAQAATEPNQAAVVQGDSPAPQSAAEIHEDVGSADSQAVGQPAGNDGSVSWVSSGEDLLLSFANWRIRMSAISVIAGAVVYLITRDFIPAGAVAIVGVTFGIVGSRKPPSLHYIIDRRGIVIGSKRYSYGDFRAFSVLDDTASPSINLVPLKRFLPTLSIHFDIRRRQEIVDLLAKYLPMEAPRRDAIDAIVNRVKF